MLKEDEWKQFDAYREMKVAMDGKILVIRPSDAATVVPLFCPLCGVSMKTTDDSISYRKVGCCEKCHLVCKGDKSLLSPEQWGEYLEERRNAPRSLFKLK
jgi:hypothetical protein